jgi:hypothetical protein
MSLDKKTERIHNALYIADIINELIDSDKIKSYSASTKMLGLMFVISAAHINIGSNPTKEKLLEFIGNTYDFYSELIKSQEDNDE